MDEMSNYRIHMDSEGFMLVTEAAANHVIRKLDEFCTTGTEQLIEVALVAGGKVFIRASRIEGVSCQTEEELRADIAWNALQDKLISEIKKEINPGFE